MSDKELDRIIKSALSSEAVPEGLNKSLLDRAEKKKSKNQKIVYITKWASSAAAVFICAVAVLSYFNSDMIEKTQIPKPQSRIVSEEDSSPKNEPSDEALLKEAPAPENRVTKENTEEKTRKEDFKTEDSLKDDTKDTVKEAPSLENNNTQALTTVDSAVKEAPAPASEAELTTDSEESEPVAASEESSEFSAEAATEENLPFSSRALNLEEENIEAYEENNITEESESAPIKARGILEKPPLSSLFSDGYDYKTEIFTNIENQIKQSGGDFFTFSKITGNEEYKIEHDGSLFIIFPEGSIAPEEHGSFEFYVGKLSGGILNK